MFLWEWEPLRGWLSDICISISYFTSHQIGWWRDAIGMSGSWQMTNQWKVVEPIPFDKRVRWQGSLSVRAFNISERVRETDYRMKVGCLYTYFYFMARVLKRSYCSFWVFGRSKVLMAWFSDPYRLDCLVKLCEKISSSLSNHMYTRHNHSCLYFLYIIRWWGW